LLIDSDIISNIRQLVKLWYFPYPDTQEENIEKNTCYNMNIGCKINVTFMV